MKILTKEQEKEYYNATVKGGAIGGLLGLGVASGLTLFATRRYPAFRQLTLPFRVFIPCSVGTFSSVIAADRAGARFEAYRNEDRRAQMERTTEFDRFERTKPWYERAKDWSADNRYTIVFASWVVSIGVSFQLVRRNKYLTTAQKVVQARVYAQGLTLAVLLASFVLEAKDVATQKGRWETIKVLDPSDPAHKRLIEKKIHHERYEGEDQWMEIIAAEEQKQKDRDAQHATERRKVEEAQAAAHAKATAAQH